MFTVDEQRDQTSKWVFDRYGLSSKILKCAQDVAWTHCNCS